MTAEPLAAKAFRLATAAPAAAAAQLPAPPPPPTNAVATVVPVACEGTPPGDIVEIREFEVMFESMAFCMRKLEEPTSFINIRDRLKTKKRIREQRVGLHYEFKY